VRVTAITFMLALGACGERLADTHAKGPAANPASSSAVLVGTAPAQPSGDPPGTTPVASPETANTPAAHNTSEVSKHEETTQKPAEGDNHAYSSVSPINPQKAGGVDPVAARDKP
jgi:hypothetical protein